MQLLFSVMGDMVHLVKILVLCNVFFVFEKRVFLHRKLVMAGVGLIMCAASAIKYICGEDILEKFVYITLIILMIYLLYKEKILRVVTTTIWMIIALTMLNDMTAVLFDISMQLLGVEGEMASDFAAEVLSLAVVWIISKLYRKNALNVPRPIGIVHLAGFTVLLEIDNVVVAMISIMNAELNLEHSRTIYLFPIFLAIIGMFIQLAAVILFFAQRNLYKEKEIIADKYLNEQISHYEYLENREKETKKFRHDLRSHMETISGLANQHEYEKMNRYLEQMNMRIESFGNMVTVHNGIVDAIMNQYYAKALENGIKMQVKGRLPADLNIDAFDLCTIFSNLLSNAYEAAIKTEEKYISMECRFNDKNIIIAVKNSYDAAGQTEGMGWKTSKEDKDYHGYGLENIRDSVKKYNGVVDIDTQDNYFLLMIMFNHNL